MFKDTKAFSGFAVKDTAEAKQFYSQILDLNVEDGQMAGIIQLNIVGGNHILIYPKPDHIPASFTILNFPVINIESAVEQLTARGVQFIIYNEPHFKTDDKGIFRGGGPKIAWFKDPAGNILSIIQQL